MKNQWIRTKLILDLYLGMVKPCIKYQMNIRKKVRKTEISLFFSKSKDHNFVKNQWIRTKLKLDLYLGMTKQCTKYQMNICKQREKKIRKTVKYLKGHNSPNKRPMGHIAHLSNTGSYENIF